MNKRKIIPSLVLNSIIFLAMIIGLILVFTYDKVGIDAFKYFTVDCNILMGISSLVYSIYLILILKNNKYKIPKTVEIFKLVTTVAVVLTLLTVCLFLAPITKDATILFINSGSLFHVTIPILSLTTWLLFEHSSNISFPESIYGLAPTGIYAIFYMAIALSHVKNGQVPVEYDWYRFTAFGVNFVPLVVILMLGVTFLISWLLWLGNKKFDIKYQTMERWQYKRFWSMFCNGLIFIMFFMALIVRYVHDPKYWDEPAWANLKFFTTQSNILIGVYALVYLIVQGVCFNKKEINKTFNLLKLLFTTYIAITFFVTVVVLAPGSAIAKLPAWPTERLFTKANILFHVFIPLLSVATWLLFEHCDNIKFRKLWYSFIYIVAYGIFYVSVAYTHVGPNGEIPMNYDWYQFCAFGPGITVVIIIAMLGVNFLFVWLLWKFNRKINIYKDIETKKQIKRTSRRG